MFQVFILTSLNFGTIIPSQPNLLTKIGIIFKTVWDFLTL